MTDLERKQSRQQALEMMHQIETLQKERDFEYVNDILKLTDLTTLSVHSLIALCRCTYRFKSFYPAWEDCFKRCLLESDNRKLDTKDLFVGML